MDSVQSDLALYHAWVSSASRRVRFVLEEKEIPYQGILVDLLAFEQHSPEYVASTRTDWCRPSSITARR